MPHPHPGSIVIVGAGHAGGTAAALLRQHGFEGELVLIGEEPIAPYQRPPLSKAYLKGEADAESLMLKTDDFYAEAGISLRLGCSVTAIDAGARKVLIEGGDPIKYDVLILATGSRPRKVRVPGAHLENIYELRSLADANALKAAIQPGRRFLIVGGGYIGFETAASARALGADVVILERESRCLARVACEPLSRFMEDFHQARGVQIVNGAGLEAFIGDARGHVCAAQLDDGRTIACDVALVGIGGQPCDDLARSAGIARDNGVMVDLAARTSDAAIFAIGDVTRRPMPFNGGRMFRLESVPNALEQAKQAVAAILGLPAPDPEVPWFWSDQYDLKLQIAGVPFEADRIVLRGAPADARFALFHLHAGRLTAVEAVNSPSEFMVGRRLIATGAAIDVAELADSSVSMKAIAAAHPSD
jgi:3-phenylpropionate/trans-cinnamate dioxygenase ferredoxin reductase subunit